jgi:hypothetical protein
MSLAERFPHLISSAADTLAPMEAKDDYQNQPG